MSDNKYRTPLITGYTDKITDSFVATADRKAPTSKVISKIFTGVDLPSGTNLDEYVTPGMWRISSNIVENQNNKLPVEEISGFFQVMTVNVEENNTDIKRIRQIYYPDDTDDTSPYTRTGIPDIDDTSSYVWSDWRMMGGGTLRRIVSMSNEDEGYITMEADQVKTQVMYELFGMHEIYLPDPNTVPVGIQIGFEQFIGRSVITDATNNCEQYCEPNIDSNGNVIGPLSYVFECVLSSDGVTRSWMLDTEKNLSGTINEFMQRFTDQDTKHNKRIGRSLQVHRNVDVLNVTTNYRIANILNPDINVDAVNDTNDLCYYDQKIVIANAENISEITLPCLYDTDTDPNTGYARHYSIVKGSHIVSPDDSLYDKHNHYGTVAGAKVTYLIGKTSANGITFKDSGTPPYAAHQMGLISSAAGNDWYYQNRVVINNSETNLLIVEFEITVIDKGNGGLPLWTMLDMDKNQGSTNQPIIPCLLGAICWFDQQVPPAGWIVCDGQVHYLVNGMTKQTPNLIGKYPLGSTENIGSEVAAGIPNVVGTVSGTSCIDSSKTTYPMGLFDGSSHAFSTFNVGDPNHTTSVGGDNENQHKVRRVYTTGELSPIGSEQHDGVAVTVFSDKNNFEFNAARGTVFTNGEYMQDSPYGKSNTVTPPSVKLLPCMYVGYKEI